MKRIILSLLLIFPCIASTEERTSIWATTVSETKSEKTEFMWESDGYEGFDTVGRINKYKNGKLVKEIKVYGQPTISENKKYVALKKCWHGGCEKFVEVINLVTMKIENKIDTSKGEFLNISWSSNVLKIEIFDPSPVEKVDEIVINYNK